MKSQGRFIYFYAILIATTNTNSYRSSLAESNDINVLRVLRGLLRNASYTILRQFIDTKLIQLVQESEVRTPDFGDWDVETGDAFEVAGVPL